VLGVEVDGRMADLARRTALRQAGAFGDPARWRFDWGHSYTRDQWLGQVPTHGGSAQLPPATLEELLAGMGAAIDAAGGAFTTAYSTVVVTAARTGEDGKP
jgi:hypothetical protein